MRRTVSLLVVASALLVAGSVAAPSGAAAPSVAAAAPVAAAGSVTGAAAETTGTTEAVDAALGYLGAGRSTTLHYPGADYVKVHLRRVLLLPGDYLTVADPDRDEVHRYGSLPDGGEWATSVSGDTAVVTLHATRSELARRLGATPLLGATVDRVARGLTPGEEEPAPAATGREESICGGNDSRDAVCYRSRHPEVYQRTRPVARLLINGTQMCTAFRVGPANRMLTNNHCIDSTREARNTEIWFDYRCAECGGWAVLKPTKVRGDRVLATDRTLDYTLFTVDDFDAVERFGYLELEPGPARSGDEIYIPQHPGGAPGRIAMESDRDRGGDCAVADPRAHGYGWQTDVSYFCDTQAGSSGSPVLSRKTHRVVALHHFGGCPNSGIRSDRLYRSIMNLGT